MPVCPGFCPLIMDLVHLSLSFSLSVKTNFDYRLEMCFERHKMSLKIGVGRSHFCGPHSLSDNPPPESKGSSPRSEESQGCHAQDLVSLWGLERGGREGERNHCGAGFWTLASMGRRTELGPAASIHSHVCTWAS